jgi:mRNA-degrading endonuclease RelE of RelBE toxin-antitoxin system
MSGIQKVVKSKGRRRREIHFEATPQFEKDLSSFSSEDRTRILSTVDMLGAVGKGRPQLWAVRILRVGSVEYESTLFTARVNPDIRIIFAIDDDPVFERTLITLFRVIRRDQLDRTMRSIKKSISQELSPKKLRRP